MAWGTDCSLSDGNVLYLIPPSNTWVTLWCFALIVCITLLYPCINFPVVTSAETVVLLLVTGEVQGTPECDQKLSELGRVSPTTCMLLNRSRELVSVAAALLVVGLDAGVSDLGSLFGLCGSLGLGSVSMLLPAVMYLRNANGAERLPLHTAAAALTLVVGLVITLGATGSIVYGLVHVDSVSNSPS
jgi:hypothetical protein